jgi:hypothetical protein
MGSTSLVERDVLASKDPVEIEAAYLDLLDVPLLKELLQCGDIRDAKSYSQESKASPVTRVHGDEPRRAEPRRRDA